VNDTWSRREALKAIVTSGGTLVVSARSRPAENKPHVLPSDPTAVALSYYEDASHVDTSKFPTCKPGDICANCLQLTGPATGEWRPCNLFPGKLVNEKGWCKMYVKKP
jgi:hypothetical protein